MIVVTGIAEISEEDVDTIKVAASRMAKASRAESGCHAYAFYEDIEQAGRFRIYEEWATADDLKGHFAMPHMMEFNSILRNVKVLNLEISQFKRGADISVNS